MVSSASSSAGGSEEDRKVKERTGGFDDQSPTSKAELNSWYLYDWANSVFSSAAVVMWLPVFMAQLAKQHACPYTWEDPNPNQTSMDIWGGYHNHSTICRYDWDLVIEDYPKEFKYFDAKGDEPAYTVSPVWWERGSSDYGLPFIPVHKRAYEPPLDDAEADRLYELDLRLNAKNKEHLFFHNRKDIMEYVTCDYPDNAVKLSPILNISLYGSGPEKTLGFYPGKKGANETFSGDDDGPVRIYFDVTEGTADASDFTVVSSNEFVIQSKDCTVTAVTDIGHGGYLFTVNPTLFFALGSSTVGIQLDNVTLMDFTITQYDSAQCPYPVDFMGMDIRPITFASLVISLSVIFQAFFFLTFSGLGDFGPYRKMILLQTGFLGSMSLMANYWIVDPADYQKVGWLFIITNLLFGASIVMYNAYLPYLTKSHPIFQAKMTEFKTNKAGNPKEVGAALKNLLLCYSDLMDSISSKGFFYGYISGVVMVLITLVIMMMNPSMEGLRQSLFVTGAWWFAFSIPMIFHLKKRPGPPLPKSSCSFYFTFSFKRLLASMYCMKHIPETRRFLLAYFLFSDAYSTIASVGILFATEEMGMKNDKIAILAAISPLCAALGIVFFRMLQVKMAYSSKKMILLTLLVVAFIPFYGLLGFLNLGFGVVQIWEMYALIVVYGFVLGAIQSSTRSAFTDIIPPGQESEFFGIYEISDKGSSWMGPAITGLLYEFTGSMRIGFGYLFFVCLVGYYLINKTNFEKGSEDCRRKEVQVRMEGIRNKLGVSKIAIQMSAKKQMGIKSGVGSSVAGSSASSVASSRSAVEEDEPAPEPAPVAPKEVKSVRSVRKKSILEVNLGEFKQVSRGASSISSSKLEEGNEEATDHDDDDDHDVHDLQEQPIDALLQRATILEEDETHKNMPRRTSSAFALRSRATGGVCGTADGEDSIDQAREDLSPKVSTQSSRSRKSSVSLMLGAGGMADGGFSGPSAVAPA